MTGDTLKGMGLRTNCSLLKTPCFLETRETRGFSFLADPDA